MKRLISVCLVLSLLICTGLIMATTGGGAGDPLISLKYINDIFIPSILSKADTELDKGIKSLNNELSERLNKITGNSDGFEYAGGYYELSFSTGGSLSLNALSSFVLSSGSANITVNSGEVIDVTTGQTVKTGSVLTPRHRYFTAEGSSALIRIYSSSAAGLVDGYYISENSGTIPSNLRFIDVSGEHWANNEIIYLADKGIVNGVGDSAFAPAGTVTRATFVTILGRLYNIDEAAYMSSSFDDVEINKWYSPYIEWASQNGIVSGYGNGKFGPGDIITREQMAVIIMRYARFADISLPQINLEASFNDQEEISSYAVESVILAQTAGIINGKDGNLFDPKGSASRAEISAVTYRFIMNAGLLN